MNLAGDICHLKFRLDIYLIFKKGYNKSYVNLQRAGLLNSNLFITKLSKLSIKYIKLYHIKSLGILFDVILN